MTYREILSRVDHTLLKQGATWEQIEAVCDDGLRFGTASVCIPPSFVKQAAEYLKGRLPVCTVIGFPNGYNTTAVKVYETAEAVGNGADEIDMVVNLGWVKEGRYDRVLEEINAVKKACAGRLLKVIIEMKAQMGEGKQIKAAGGISGFHDAEIFIRLGADRLGTSRLAEQAKKKEVELDEEV